MILDRLRIFPPPKPIAIKELIKTKAHGRVVILPKNTKDLTLIPEFMSSAKIALTHRLGISHLDPIDINTIFSKAIRQPENVKIGDFNNLVHRGTCTLMWYSMQYIQKRWPQLDTTAKRIAMTTYTAPGNLARIAKLLGMSITLEGFPKNLGPIRAKVKCGVRLYRSMNDILNRKVYNKKQSLKYADTLLAVIGALQKKGQERGFLDSFVLSSHFDHNRLVKPVYPIVKLTELLRQRGGLEADGNLVFRLGKETGRQSNDSMYMLGVFTSKTSTEPIGEGIIRKGDQFYLGFGASINLARHRACLDALRKILMVDKGHVDIRTLQPLSLDPKELSSKLSEFMGVPLT